MPVDAIRLRCFRGFRDAELELKPLTVLVGPNSSGKSSFSQALAAMAHAQRVFESGVNFTLTPPRDPQLARAWPVDLGLLEDLRTTGTEGPVRVGLRTPEGWVDFGFGLEGLYPDLRLSYIAHPRVLDVTQVRPGSIVGVPSESNASTTVSLDSAKAVVAPAEPQSELQRVNDLLWRDEETKSLGRAVLEGLLLVDWRPAPQTSGLGQPTGPAVNWSAWKATKDLLSGLSYLRATRERPSRGYAPRTELGMGVGYAGEMTTSVLREHSSPVIFREPPESLPRERARDALDRIWPERAGSLGDALSFWLEHLGLATSATVRERERRLELRFALGGTTADHDVTEVGFGLSQVLPVLVAGLTTPTDATLIVDLPEAHLHPGAQGSLADFFCSLALSRRRALVETHSDVFFHRLRVLAEMNSAVRDVIGVYFLDAPHEGLCAQPRPVGLRAEDELRWPVGFLHEDWDLENEVQALREARRGAR